MDTIYGAGAEPVRTVRPVRCFVTPPRKVEASTVENHGNIKAVYIAANLLKTDGFQLLKKYTF